MPKFSKKNCPPETHILNANGICVKICNNDTEVRNATTGRCNKKNRRNNTKRYNKNCKANQELTEKNNCVRKCAYDKVRNRSSGRCKYNQQKETFHILFAAYNDGELNENIPGVKKMTGLCEELLNEGTPREKLYTYFNLRELLNIYKAWVLYSNENR